MDDQDPIPLGRCHCGCGAETKIATSSSARDGSVRGQPSKYVSGHNSRSQVARPHFNRSLDRWVVCSGGTKVYWYRIVAEDMLGRPLAPNEIVHHINGDPSDDRPENLEVLTRKEHAARHPENPKPPKNYGNRNRSKGATP